MSIRSSLTRRLVGVALSGGLVLGGLAIPSAAHAEVLGTCVPVPVTTPGVTVGGKHIPALSHIEVCAFTSFWEEVRSVRVQQFTGCGSPCFAVYIDSKPVQAGFGGVSVVIRWWEDGIEMYPIPALFIPGVDLGWDPPSETCLIAVGTPTPSC